MMRIEIDASTGDSREIPCAAYQTTSGDIILVDDGQPVPAGAVPAAPAAPPVPAVVTRLQAKAALLQANLLDAAEAHFAQAGVDPLARLAWVEATTFERDSLLVMATANALNLTAAQVDDLFRTAARIEL